MQAGELRERFEFQEREKTNDGYGNEQGVWRPRFERSARRRELTGGEQVMASRLEGRVPAVITVRMCSQTKLVTADWRLRDVHNGEIWNIRAPKRSEKPTDIDFLVEKGVATN